MTEQYIHISAEFTARRANAGADRSRRSGIAVWPRDPKWQDSVILLFGSRPIGVAYFAWCSGIPHLQAPGLSESVLQPQEPPQLQK